MPPSAARIPRISVVIPLYNKGPYIARALDSVLAQTMRDFEIVVVDDASTDGGPEIVERRRDPRIRLIRRDKPGPGGHAARNAGIRAAAAPLVAFLDADDLYNPDFLSVILELARKYEGAGAFGTSFEIVWENARRSVWTVGPLRDAGATDVLIGDFCRNAVSGPVIGASAAAVPKTTFADVGMFPEGEPLGGDLDMWLRVGIKYPIAVSAYVGSVAHRDAGNRIDTGKILGRDYALVSTGLRLLASGGLDRRRRRDLREYVAMYQITTASQLVMLGRRERALETLRACRTVRWLPRKAWWLMWALLPTRAALAARTLKRTLAGAR